MKVCVIIPSYRVKNKILDVINNIPDFIDKIFVIDDKCPEFSGKYVEDCISDLRVQVIYHDINKGVGGALKTGYRAAVEQQFDIAVKIDGDGQMNPVLISRFIAPLLSGKADYTKGNRFFKLQYLRKMPKIRLFGNSGLSFLTKLSTGNWNIMDPTNGYTAIRLGLLEFMDLEDIDSRYFFETDMLFQLGIIHAKVVDIPMVAVYEDEESSLSVKKVLFEFSYKHIKLFIKRLFISYFLRDFNIGSVFLLMSFIFTILTLGFGVPLWLHNSEMSIETPTGTVIMYLLFSILSLSGIIGWILYDVFASSNNPISNLLDK